MVTFTISFDDDVVERWSALAAAQGVDLDEKMTQAIVDRMEEMEDYAALKARFSKPGETLSREELMSRVRGERRATISHEDFMREMGLSVADQD
jgi:hypothetical protein